VSREASVVGLAAIDDSPEVMTERAREVAAALGYPEERPYEEVGYEYDEGYIAYVVAGEASSDRWDVLRSDRPSAIGFWYRGSPVPLLVSPPTLPRPDQLRWVNLTRPPHTEPGMLTIVLDAAGRLTSLVAVPLPGDTVARQPDWAALFDLAGLPMDGFSTWQPERIPPVYADRVAAWQGVLPGRPDVPLRVEAAAAAGRPVYFAVQAPWTQPADAEDFRPDVTERILGLLGIVALLVVVLLALLARRNLRLGRSDRRGAMRMAVVIGAAYFVPEALRAWDGQLGLLIPGAAARAVFLWVAYVALEPHIRSVWPTMVVGWNRLLLGRLRDPLVGRDLLVGTLVGVGTALWVSVPRLPLWGAEALAPGGSETGSDILLGGRFAVRFVLGPAVGNGFINGVVLLGILLVAYLVLRRRPVAIAATFLLALLNALEGSPEWGPEVFRVLLVAAPVIAVSLLLLLRLGVLPLMVSLSVRMLALAVPITLDSSVPYAEASYLMIATILGTAGYGFHTALAGRPVFGPRFFGEEPART